MNFLKIYLAIVVVIGVCFFESYSYKLPIKNRLCKDIDSTRGATDTCELCVDLHDLGEYIKNICDKQNKPTSKLIGLIGFKYAQIQNFKCQNLKNMITTVAPWGLVTAINSLTEKNSTKRSNEICVTVAVVEYSTT